MEIKVGDTVRLINPVLPEHHAKWAQVKTISDYGELRYELYSLGSSQWYSAKDFFKTDSNNLIQMEMDKKAWLESLEKQGENLDSEAWNEYEDKKLCDQYKEAVSQATEDLKESACSLTHERDAIDFQLAEIFKKQSTSTTFTRRSPNNEINYGIDKASTDSEEALAYVLYAEGVKAGTSVQNLLKKALALLAEQKQKELKEIEELIKKL